MTKIDVRKIIEEKIPDFYKRLPETVAKLFELLISKILKVKELNKIFEIYHDKYNFEFIDSFFEYINFKSIVSTEDIKKIPAKGKLVCIANHPLGALDGLALLQTVGKVRKDVKIIANNILLNLDFLKELFLPVDSLSKKIQKTSINLIIDSLKRDEAIIIFPGASVARLTLAGIRDYHWKDGAFKFALKYNAPILPFYVSGKNSMMFYFANFIHTKLPNLLLAREILKKSNKSIELKVGELIEPENLKKRNLNIETIKQLLRNYIINIGKKKSASISLELDNEKLMPH
mgnify:FL=1